jgi:hypothetical protein
VQRLHRGTSSGDICFVGMMGAMRAMARQIPRIVTPASSTSSG